MDGAAATYEALTALNRRVTAIMVLAAIPLDFLIYVAHYLTRPCWQFAIPVATTTAMSAGWVAAFVLARRGQLQKSVAAAALSLVLHTTAVLMVRDRSLAVCMLTFAAATIYASIFSRRLLVLCAGLMGASVLGFEVLDALGVLSLAMPTLWLHRLFEGGFLLLIVPVLLLFVLERERIGRLPFEALEVSASEQRLVLEAVARVLPGVDALVARLRQLGAALAAQASQQAATASEVSAAMDALRSMSGETAHAAAQTRALADEARRSGDQSSEQLVSVEQQFRAAVDVLRTALVRSKHLAELSERTGEIVEAMRDVDDQVGMLALNASIEAAKAGESGRGFAVVANELQRLMGASAERSVGSAELLQSIRREAMVLANDSESTSHKLDEHLGRLRETADQVLKISASQTNAAGQVDRIAAAVEQQRSQVASVSTAMRDATESAVELSRLAQEIDGNVAEVVKGTDTLREATRGANASRPPEKSAIGA
ncbi:MAG: methyl-accepting chemotaxis protein [Myxococcales bacterium]